MKRFHFPLDRLLRLKRQQLAQSETAIQRSSLQMQLMRQQVALLQDELLRVSERITLGDAADIMNIQVSSHHLQNRIEQFVIQLTDMEAKHKDLVRNHRQLDGKVKAWESMRESAFAEFRAGENRKDEHELELRMLGERYREANVVNPAGGISE